MKDAAEAIGQLVPAVARLGIPVRIMIDGEAADVRAGDSILAAVLLRRRMLRRNEFDGTPRAGFCLMGACQDCWVWLDGEARVRACTTPVAEGMRIDFDEPGDGAAPS